MSGPHERMDTETEDLLTAIKPEEIQVKDAISEPGSNICNF